WSGASPCTCSTPIWSRTILPTGSSHTGCTVARWISGCGKSGSWALVASACCARWANGPRPGTPTKGTRRSCCWSGCASRSRKGGALWPGKDAARIPIGHVTNGVHLATWMSQRTAQALDAQLGHGWIYRVDEPGFWDCVLTMDDAALWAAHMEMKVALLRAIREDARRRWAEQWKEALHSVGAGTLLDERALTIGFARRFATYKRATLL